MKTGDGFNEHECTWVLKTLKWWLLSLSLFTAAKNKNWGSKRDQRRIYSQILLQLQKGILVTPILGSEFIAFGLSSSKI